MTDNSPSPQLEILRVFLRLGVIAFGGPAAHISLMEQELVVKRKWLDHEHFLDLVAMLNLIPGPNSTQLVLALGHHRGGKLGLIIAGLAFILPAALLTLIFGWFYMQYGAGALAINLLAGLKAVVIALVFWAMFRFGQKSLVSPVAWVAAIAALAADTLRVPVPVTIIGTGLLTYLWTKRPERGQLNTHGLWLSVLPVLGATTKPAADDPATLGTLFGIFFKTGAIMFGSGYVLFAFLEPEFVHRLGWLSLSQMGDAIAIGQFTPGPVLTTSTFIGYQMAGILGAALATLGIFLPSFLFLLLLNPFIPKLRSKPGVKAFLVGAKAAAVSLILIVVYKLAADTLSHWVLWVLTLASAGLLWKFPKLNAMLLMLSGGILAALLM